MKKRKIIVAVISIIVTISLGIFLFNQDPDFIKIKTSDSKQVSAEECTLTPTQNCIKNAVISIVCGGTIYCIFYALPYEYNNTRKHK